MWNKIRGVETTEQVDKQFKMKIIMDMGFYLRNTTHYTQMLINLNNFCRVLKVMLENQEDLDQKDPREAKAYQEVVVLREDQVHLDFKDQKVKEDNQAQLDLLVRKELLDQREDRYRLFFIQICISSFKGKWCKPF